MQLFVKDLTVIDFSYLCPLRGMVGESWIVDVLLEGVLDQQNMVLDFGKVKRTIKQVIDQVADHRLLIPTACGDLRWQQQNDTVWIDFASRKGTIHLGCPAEAFALVPNELIDFDSVNDFLINALRDVLPENVDNISLTLRSELLDGPFYHYSHGLKKHDGNCQRIAHGHRSPVKVFEDGVAAPEWDRYWAERWKDVYLGSESDMVPIEQLTMSPQCRVTDDSHYGFCYTAPQGEFQLAMPKGCCDLIPHDTTIELLAQFMADTLSAKMPGRQYRVMAFEGIGKGAIAVAGTEKH
ncbi:6-carboxytetrahydropterin synthase [Shewanella yunxiaonensis]|uniref:6-carboxy-5,6,7,8-tetrahydropterin synthase n=1 Tax=Shewanella yunxiaonensis TaxID=2829809 RepID=A0ABX7YX86_9GAMM|nr:MULTISPECIES: 6-carboxytetrahydropterin synthase [Shewanella]MDF0535476.1 6-carboxytetrahydropterin synthase [Shewanella sp. A32]QUN07317.1 6-carboxytetrahydropterin synthase [Shewanella yunxiaonensis]